MEDTLAVIWSGNYCKCKIHLYNIKLINSMYLIISVIRIIINFHFFYISSRAIGGETKNCVLKL